MQAVVLTPTRPELALRTLEDPEPGPRDVLLRVTGCGICGSDLHVASQVGDPGTILGHEIVGTIEAVGRDVDAARWPRGSSVAVRPFSGCGHCSHCQRGRADHCPDFALLGLSRPGGFAELTTVPARELFALPATVAGLEQALIEPLAVARRAVRRAALHPSDTVAVLGAGPIGLAIVAWAAHVGVERIIISDPVAQRRALATRLGATVAVDPTADPIETAVATSIPEGPTVVFECTGRPGLIQQAMTIAAVDGRVVVVGICLALDSTYPYTALHKELDVRYAIYYGREDFTDTINALDRHTLSVAAMITETVNLAQLPARFAQLTHTPDAGKVVLVP